MPYDGVIRDANADVEYEGKISRLDDESTTFIKLSNC